MATETRRKHAARPERVVLRGVLWRTYLDLRHRSSNDRLRMTYLDGTLILMSPQYIHDKSGWRLAMVVDWVTAALRIPCQGTATTTLSREGPGPRKGSGKEPDYGFYFGENEPRMRTKEQIDLNVDPPPDLAIEVDNKADSSKTLPIYARLGVPEVWRYQVKSKSLWFGRLAGDSYEPIDRSLHLPRLTPALVLQALEVADRLGESEWKLWLLDWARGLPEAPPTP
ncbi:Uma2 family endonuclease [Tundrisphaera lichenicola]|uniref:Uma2 family endonuclease n=1 Tax=Tundrisphaera lichenicola TaxID=2029860 RepID=UPI003EBFD701